MALTTRLTERLGIEHPIISAPMAFAAGGRLASAVTAAGGLGLIGGWYGDGDWLEQEFREAGNARVGCGFITWSLAKAPHLLDRALAHRPRAVFFSFGDAAPFAGDVKAVGAALILQVQTLKDAKAALDLGADVVVAQGAEAGGHGERRATLTLVPEVADAIARGGYGTLLCAAGGIADGRGLAAALMLGADGAVVGSRLWASSEALVHRNMLDRAIAATGDDTVRQKVTDIARGYDWPERYDIRVVRNAYVDRWLGREEEMRAAGEGERQRYAAGVSAGDASIGAAICGEAAGLIHDVRPAGEIVAALVGQAESLLGRAGRFVRT
jgi:nitronate monooxygenase